MSHVQAYYHIVINTKGRRMTLPSGKGNALYSYMAGIARNMGTYILAVNGIGNHIHILVNLSPTLALSDFVKELKRATSLWIKQQPDIRDFDYWGKEYFAASVSRMNCKAITKYIENQAEHHRLTDFETELRHFVESTGGEWNNNMLT